MGPQRVRYDLVTTQQQEHTKKLFVGYLKFKFKWAYVEPTYIKIIHHFLNFNFYQHPVFYFTSILYFIWQPNVGEQNVPGQMYLWHEDQLRLIIFKKRDSREVFVFTSPLAG